MRVDEAGQPRAVRTPSLRKMRARCPSAVRKEMPKSMATTLFERLFGEMIQQFALARRQV